MSEQLAISPITWAEHRQWRDYSTDALVRLNHVQGVGETRPLLRRLIPQLSESTLANPMLVMLLGEMRYVSQLIGTLGIGSRTTTPLPLTDVPEPIQRANLLHGVMTRTHPLYRQLIEHSGGRDGIWPLVRFITVYSITMTSDEVEELMVAAVTPPFDTSTTDVPEVVVLIDAIERELDSGPPDPPPGTPRPAHDGRRSGPPTPATTTSPEPPSPWAPPNPTDAVGSDRPRRTFAEWLWPSANTQTAAEPNKQTAAEPAELPDWCPRWLRELQPHRITEANRAYLFGLTHPWQEICRYVAKLRSPATMVAVTAVLIISSLNVVDGDLRNFFFVVAGALGGLQGALVWRRTHATVDGKERALGSTLAGIAGAPSWFVAFHVIASRAIAGLLAVAVIARAVFRVWRDTQDDKYFTWLETMRSTKVDRIRPWAVVWATVKNDNDEEATWGKIRPCIVLPPRETWRNHRPPSSAEYYGPDGNPVFSDGYPVLICTSQSKRADDPRYLEVHPFINSTQSDLRFTRSYVNLSRLYIVPYMSGTEASMNSKSVEYQMLTSGNFDEFIVVESLGPLLNDADSERICGALEELGYF